MKRFITFVLTIIMAIMVYGGAIINSCTFSANCIDYFELAANANSVELAEKYLSNGIEYLEKEGLTQGNTNFIFKYPTNDINIWYENLKSAQAQLQELKEQKDLTELEETNSLMKLRETLVDEDGVINHPRMISFYPYHILMEILMWGILIIGFFVLVSLDV